MKSVSINNIILLCLAASYCVLAYNVYDLRKTQEELSKKQESFNQEISVRLDSTEDLAIKANVYNKAIAKSVLYLDSCQQSKTVKQDRAEKRGRFVGGLLKGLFPGI